MPVTAPCAFVVSRYSLWILHTYLHTYRERREKKQETEYSAACPRLCANKDGAKSLLWSRARTHSRYTHGAHFARDVADPAAGVCQGRMGQVFQRGTRKRAK